MTKHDDDWIQSTLESLYGKDIVDGYSIVEKREIMERLNTAATNRKKLMNTMDKDLKPYIGCKIIGAKPMNDEDFTAHKKERGSKATTVTDSIREGYLVVYEDGYESWSPKDTFERAYRLVSEQEAGLISLMKPEPVIEHSKIVNAIFDSEVDNIIVSAGVLTILSRAGECYSLLSPGYSWNTLEEVGHLERGGKTIRILVDSELEGVVVYEGIGDGSVGYERGNTIYHHGSHTWVDKRHSVFYAICALDATAIVVSEYINTFLADFKQYVFDTSSLTKIREWREDKSENSIFSVGVLHTRPMIDVNMLHSIKVYVDDRLDAMGDTIYEYKDGKRGNTLMTIDINNLV